MAASVPTVDAVMLKSFGRPKIMEALELFGVRADARRGKAPRRSRRSCCSSSRTRRRAEWSVMAWS